MLLDMSVYNYVCKPNYLRNGYNSINFGDDCMRISNDILDNESKHMVHYVSVDNSENKNIIHVCKNEHTFNKDALDGCSINNEINKEIYDSLVRKTEMRDLKQCKPDNKINSIVTLRVEGDNCVTRNNNELELHKCEVNNEFQKFVKVIDQKTKSYQFKDLDNELCIQEEEGDRLFMSKCKDIPNNKWNISNPEKIINGNNKCFNTKENKLNVKTCGEQENVRNLEALCPDCNKHNDTVRLINNTYAYDSIPEKQVENINIDPFWKEYLNANKDKLGDLDVNMFGHKDNEWEYNGVKLCIGKGSPSEQCDNKKLFCAGGDTYGENDRVINAIVESALRVRDKNLQHPKCPVDNRRNIKKCLITQNDKIVERICEFNNEKQRFKFTCKLNTITKKQECSYKNEIDNVCINYVDNKLIAGPCQDNETSFWKKADNNIYKENKQFVVKEGNDKNNIIKSVCM